MSKIKKNLTEEEKKKLRDAMEIKNGPDRNTRTVDVRLKG